MTLLVFTVACTEHVRKPFSFVQICDTQLGMGGYEHDVKRFKLAMQKINELKPDFAIICGDLVHNANDSSYADFLKIKDEFDVACYVASGNHDIGNVPNDTTLSFYRKTIGKDYYEFHHKGYSFIVTNTQLWKAYVGKESEKHDTWFKETLKQQSAKQHPVFVVGHYPLYLKFPEEEEQYFNIPPNKRQELLQLFPQNNVKAYLSGHTHKLVTHHYQNIQLVSGETTSKNFDKRPFGFRLWHVSPDSIYHEFVPLQPAIKQQSETVMH